MKTKTPPDLLNKEIKFRIWCNSLKRIIYNPYVKDIYNERDQINDYFNGKNNQFIWMLYSNCTDNKGNDVYEGDIIRTNSHRDYFGHKDTIVIVKFSAGKFFREGKTSYLEGISSYLDQVIGNIFENPELLELC